MVRKRELEARIICLKHELESARAERNEAYSALRDIDAVVDQSRHSWAVPAGVSVNPIPRDVSTRTIERLLTLRKEQSLKASAQVEERQRVVASLTEERDLYRTAFALAVHADALVSAVEPGDVKFAKKALRKNGAPRIAYDDTTGMTRLLYPAPSTTPPHKK